MLYSRINMRILHKHIHLIRQTRDVSYMAKIAVVQLKVWKWRCRFTPVLKYSLKDMKSFIQMVLFATYLMIVCIFYVCMCELDR